jgi:DNA repair protein RecN (Recombination protein N)
VLLELHVKNLAVLAGAGIELGTGFNVLSGETGAGKSIVVDGLSLLAGSRASSELIRTGAESLTVTGLFAPAGAGWRALLAAAGVETDGPEILVRREIHRNGRNRLYIDDQPTTLRTLGELAPHLLRIHGQREELGLTTPELQRRWLDQAGGAEAEQMGERVAAAHGAWAEAHERLERLSGDAREREERIDFLRFQAREIDAARLVAGEDDELRAERAVLRHSEQITHALGSSVESLFDDDGAATERLARAEDALAGIEDWQPEAAAWRAELEGARITIEEAARAMRGRLDGIEADPARLDQVEERLAVLERLAKKYGGSVTATAAVLERRREIGAELEELEGARENREALEERAARALDEFRRLALDLSSRRAAWGEELTRRVHEEIADLGLEKARLGVALERRRDASSPLELAGEPVEFSAFGLDHVVFLFAPNPGEEPQPLARIASGGELSRLALGFQLALQKAHPTATAGEPGPTLVFDEVDSGISGAQAAALGRKLRRLADGADRRSAQILAVTHLPQVASFGHRHFRVEKSVADGRTITSVVALGDDDRVAEVARMLAGERVTDLSLSHARELLDGAVAPAGT